MELLKSLFENAELPSDFKEKTATIFEAAVDERVKAELVKLQEAADAQATAAKEAYVAEATATIDAVVEETVLEWAKENAVALDSQVKGQLAESFLKGLKGIFEQADIELNSDTASARIAELTEATKEAEAKAEAAKTALVEAEQKLVQHQIKEILESKTAGLADTVAHRVTKLCEAFDFKSAEDYAAKVDMVMEAVAGIKGTIDGDGVQIPVTSTTSMVKDKVSTEAGTHGPEDGELLTKPAGSKVKSAEGDKGVGTKVSMDPLKEAYDAQRDQYAPHLESDLVAETLKLFSK
jgi:hypothetical protein